MALCAAFAASAQTGLQQTPGGVQYQCFTNKTGERIKVGDFLTFDIIQKTDKDSVLMSSFTSPEKPKMRVADPAGVSDYVEANLMKVLQQVTLNDSLLVRVPTDSIFKGHEDQRPAFFAKGSYLNFIFKIEKIQQLDDVIRELKSADSIGAAKYIADHKLTLKKTASGLRYLITLPTTNAKPLPGDTLLVNYTGRTVDDVVFDSSIESVAKEAGLNQPGRTYEPIQFTVGAGGIIQGWDEGLQLVPEGGKAILVIPSELAYGDRGSDPIKPYSTLIFDIELVKIKHGKHSAGTAGNTAAGSGTPATVMAKIANMRATPSSKGELVLQLSAGAKLSVIAGQDTNGYCKVIDVKTNKTGWVLKSAVKM